MGRGHHSSFESLLTEPPFMLIGQLFPNPLSENGLVYIALKGHFDHTVVIKTHSEKGEIVHASEHKLPEWGDTVELDFSGLKTGEYQVLIRCRQHVEYRRLRIEKQKKGWTWAQLFSWF